LNLLSTIQQVRLFLLPSVVKCRPFSVNMSQNLSPKSRVKRELPGSAILTLTGDSRKDYKGSMSSDTIARLARYVETQARPVDKFGHQPRLIELTRAIGADFAYDQEVVAAAAWLHDLGVFIGHRPDHPEDLASWDHVAYACSQAPGLLRQVEFPEEKISAVLAAIQQHQPADEPATLETTILRDADILEQLGATGILRTVSKVGRDTRFPRFTDAVAVLRRNLEDLPRRLRLESARRLAAPRIAILQQFLQAVHNECGANLL
jgi:uncharacterized protein